jgi:hypothetical protein
VPAVAERHSFVRVPALALMTRRLRLAPSDASTAAAGRFVRDTCRNWGVPDDLIGESSAVVRALVESVDMRSGGAFDLVVEARSHTVTVQVRDRDRCAEPRTPRRGADRRGDARVKPWTAGSWTFVSGADPGEIWAIVPRDRQPAPEVSRPWPR